MRSILSVNLFQDKTPATAKKSFKGDISAFPHVHVGNSLSCMLLSPHVPTPSNNFVACCYWQQISFDTWRGFPVLS